MLAAALNLQQFLRTQHCAFSKYPEFRGQLPVFRESRGGTCLATAKVAATNRNQVTLKIERAVDGKRVLLRLSGRLRTEHLAVLKSLIEDGTRMVTLDLDEITQVDVDAVNFLRKCRTEGIELRHCSPYICEWMNREQQREE
jgi:hypothetical protein